MTYPNPEYFRLIQLLESIRAGKQPHPVHFKTIEHRVLTAIQITLGAN